MIRKHHIERVHVTICPAEGDLKNVMELVECQVRRKGKKTSDHRVVGQGHVNQQEVIRLGVHPIFNDAWLCILSIEFWFNALLCILLIGSRFFGFDRGAFLLSIAFAFAILR